jgi:UDP-glucuronate decarboxylase
LHAAGVASPVYYMRYPLETIDSAVQGTKNLLELARKNKHLESFIFFSSSEIYGDPDPGSVPTPETYHGYVSSVGPRACYDESKRLGETIATVYQQRYDVPVKIVRPFNVFGPGMRHDDRRVIPMFTYEALNGRPLPVHSDGSQTRTFCYITDAICGFLQTLLKGKVMPTVRFPCGILPPCTPSWCRTHRSTVRRIRIHIRPASRSAGAPLWERRHGILATRLGLI